MVCSSPKLVDYVWDLWAKDPVVQMASKSAGVFTDAGDGEGGGEGSGGGGGGGDGERPLLLLFCCCCCGSVVLCCSFSRHRTA